MHSHVCGAWFPLRHTGHSDDVWDASDLAHVRGLGLALDSWGGDPFTIWLDGISAE